jgi:multiple sugar transport system substrate-binding protein
MQIMPWDVFYQKLLPAFGAHDGPDLVGMDSNQIPVYASKNMLQPIDSIFGSGGVQKSSIVGPALAAGEYQGKIYGVPFENTPVLLYYNKKMFAAAGLDPSKPPTNWSEWAADAKKLTIGSGPGGKPSQYGMAFGVHDTIELMPILMWEAGGGILSTDGKQMLLNNSGSKQTAQYWADLVHNDHVSPVGLSGADADKLIQSGKAAMEVNGPWATTGYKQAGIDYGLTPVPAGPNGQSITLGNTTGLAASSALSASQIKALGEFYKFWTQTDSQTYFALHTGFPPVSTNVPLSSLKSNPDVAAFAGQAGNARGLAPGQPSFAQIQGEVFDPAIEKIFNSPSSTSSELDAAAKQVQSLISSGG